MKQRTYHGVVNQKGIALPIVMVLLLLAALVALYTVNTSVKEQQVTADQYRSEQAFVAAQAGVEAAVALHNSFDRDATPVVSAAAFSVGRYKVMFCDIWDDDGDEAVTASLMADFVRDTNTCTHYLNDEPEPYDDGFAKDARVGVISLGKPDDDSGVRVISIISSPGLKINNGSLDFVPLSAKGSVSITGNITVVNRYSNINVWSGSATGSGSNSVESYITDPSNPVDVTLDEDAYRAAMISESYPAPPNAMLASKQDLGNNSDILTNDINLRDLDEGEMFSSLFSNDPEGIAAIAYGIEQRYTTGTVEGGLKSVDELKDTDNFETGLMWLDYSGNSPVTLNVGTLESSAFMVIKVEPGDTLTINGGTIHGMVFVIGDAQLGGNVVIKGSMIATGNVDKSGGTPIIVYDPSGLAFDPEGLAGLRGIEPGTWKDWTWDDGS